VKNFRGSCLIVSEKKDFPVSDPSLTKSIPERASRNLQGASVALKTADSISSQGSTPEASISSGIFAGCVDDNGSELDRKFLGIFGVGDPYCGRVLRRRRAQQTQIMRYGILTSTPDTVQAASSPILVKANLLLKMMAFFNAKAFTAQSVSPIPIYRLERDRRPLITPRL
jgi:hypothetical protein